LVADRSLKNQQLPHLQSKMIEESKSGVLTLSKGVYGRTFD
jgi:hypothetical protein